MAPVDFHLSLEPGTDVRTALEEPQRLTEMIMALSGPKLPRGRVPRDMVPVYERYARCFFLVELPRLPKGEVSRRIFASSNRTKDVRDGVEKARRFLEKDDRAVMATHQRGPVGADFRAEVHCELLDLRERLLVPQGFAALTEGQAQNG